jgi:hypothetical protein
MEIKLTLPNLRKETGTSGKLCLSRKTSNMLLDFLTCWEKILPMIKSYKVIINFRLNITTENTGLTNTNSKFKFVSLFMGIRIMPIIDIKPVLILFFNRTTKITELYTLQTILLKQLNWFNFTLTKSLSSMTK